MTKKSKAPILREKKSFPLVEVQEPNLLRDMFPYTEPPKVTFDGLDVPLDPPQEVFITDTTFRDGQQAKVPYTVEQIVTLFESLHRLGGPNGVIRQSEFFLYSDTDRRAVEKCLAKGYKYPEVTGWIRAVKSDFQLVKAMGLKETGILTSASDYHIFLKLGWDRKVAMKNYLDIAAAALEAGIIPRCHFEDVTRADIYGFVVPLAQELMKLSGEAKMPVKIRLCDTMGYGVPYPGATLPRSVPRLVHAMMNDAGVPKEQLEWHGHNDFHKAMINASTAWLYGCAAGNGTLLGFGERTGNPPLEGLVFEYIGLVGHANGMDTRVVTEIAEYLQKDCGVEVPTNYPFVGKNFNVTAAGVHADGLIKNEEIYNIFDTGKLLDRPLGINLNNKSGLAGIAYWVNHFLKPTRKIDKQDPAVARINEWIQTQYDAGRTTVISTEEMMVQVRAHLPELLTRGDADGEADAGDEDTVTGARRVS